MLQMLKKVKLLMIRQKMDSLSFELLSRMAHMMTRMTHADSLARSLSRPVVGCAAGVLSISAKSMVGRFHS